MARVEKRTVCETFPRNKTKGKIYIRQWFYSKGKFGSQIVKSPPCTVLEKGFVRADKLDWNRLVRETVTGMYLDKPREDEFGLTDLR